MACQESPKIENEFFEIENIGMIKNKKLNEISGIARSTFQDDIFWVINDSGDDPIVYAINRAGALVHQAHVKDALNIDWEDISSFEYENKSFLLIADCGNNTSPRDIFNLYIIEEPDVSVKSPKSQIRLSWRIDFSFPDGPRDCEAVTVDPLNQIIYLLSKRDVPAHLYFLPLLSSNSNKVIVAEKLGPVNSIPQPKPQEIKRNSDKYHAQPTSMDFSQNGSTIAVLTEKNLFLYSKKNSDSWIRCLNSVPLKITFPKLQQAEAVCFDDNSTVLITSEKLPAPILKVSLKGDVKPR